MSRVSASSSTTSTVQGGWAQRYFLQDGGEPVPVNRLDQVVDCTQGVAQFLSSTIVNMMTGMSARSGSAFNAVRMPQPSMPGIITSKVMAARAQSLASRSPSSPLSGDCHVILPC